MIYISLKLQLKCIYIEQVKKIFSLDFLFLVFKIMFF